MEQEFQLIKKAYQTNPFPDLESRKQSLDSLKLMILENELQIISAIDKDFTGRSHFESQIAEIYPSIKAIKHSKKNLANWMQPEKRKVSIWFKPASAKVIYQPLGVTAIIVPWNYPLYMAIGPLVCALSAGNRVMLKMSEFTPNFSELFAELIEKYLPQDLVTVINGGAEVGEQFSRLPFDHILFTGSSRVGKMVMQAASKNLTPVTLELGGKSPTIIDKKYPIKTAAERIIFGKLLNAGQTCLAPDYVFVHESKQQEFVQACKQICQSFHPQWNNKDFTAINSEKQFQRQKEMRQDAIDKGGEVVYLNNFSSELEDGRQLSPVLVIQTSEDMLIRQEEIFGPTLPVVVYQELDEVIEYVNNNPRPLALYLFSYDKNNINKMMLNTISGGVTLNDTLLHVSQEELPFGGVGNSGMGHYHGIDGFRTFSKTKSVFKQSRWAASKIMYPPYGKLAQRIYKMMLGR